jgi:hypothetical protein
MRHVSSMGLCPGEPGGKKMVLRKGLEPLHPKALPPEDSVSTNSTT